MLVRSDLRAFSIKDKELREDKLYKGRGVHIDIDNLNNNNNDNNDN